MEPGSISPMMGQLWSPLVAVTSHWRGKVNAQIAVSVGAASVVPEQPRVVVQIYKENFSWELLQNSGAFALNFLRPDQLHLIKAFGLVSGVDVDKLSEIAHRFGLTGSPILEDCWGYLDCRVINGMDGGDMTCFLAEVVDGETISEGEPFWWPQARRVIPAEWNWEWEAKIAEQIQKSNQRMGHIDYTSWNPAKSLVPISRPRNPLIVNDMNEITSLIEKIHATPHKAVIAVAGAGSQAIAWLLGVSGASRTILETIVPYGRLSMIDLLGNEPEHYVSPMTAQDMAKAAYQRGMRLREDDSPVIGVACTATIATDRTKRGDHRAFIATWDDSQLRQYDLVLEKGARDRAGEEELVSRLLLQSLAQSSGVEAGFPLGLTGNESPHHDSVPHLSWVQRLIAGEIGSLTVYSDGRMVPDEHFNNSARRVLFPGSFSPLHQGHQTLVRVVSEMLSAEVVSEISVTNVDKPPLDETEILKRVGQFLGNGKVVLSRAETFYKKSQLFPGSTFVVGWDTAVRLVDPKYYNCSETDMLTALAEMWASGCRFLVAGRVDGDRFKGLAEVPVPQGFHPIFQAIPESNFRVDLSSTELRDRC